MFDLRFPERGCFRGGIVGLAAWQASGHHRQKGRKARPKPRCSLLAPLAVSRKDLLRRRATVSPELGRTGRPFSVKPYPRLYPCRIWRSGLHATYGNKHPARDSVYWGRYPVKAE